MHIHHFAGSVFASYAQCAQRQQTRQRIQDNVQTWAPSSHNTKDHQEGTCIDVNMLICPKHDLHAHIYESIYTRVCLLYHADDNANSLDIGIQNWQNFGETQRQEL